MSDFTIRPARPDDVPALEELIPLSTRELMAAYHTPEQMDAALGVDRTSGGGTVHAHRTAPVFGVDRQLIADGTYFLAEVGGRVMGCGGWSRRKAVFGGDRDRPGEDGTIDPARDPARIRAFFVHPDFARRGIGRALLKASEEAIRAAGFRDIVMVATLAGEPLYAAMGYAVQERYEVPLSNGLTLPVVRMGKKLDAGEA
ncbi:MAG TPA: GNAT family N-acetyltransferase [Gemmataceae bacterium]|nr:GNAT family N-acetyltransferase [Gemmataceae bacterium]